jgi:hypothetical protein
MSGPECPGWLMNNFPAQQTERNPEEGKKGQCHVEELFRFHSYQNVLRISIGKKATEQNGQDRLEEHGRILERLPEALLEKICF